MPSPLFSSGRDLQAAAREHIGPRQKQIGANLPHADNEWTPAHVVTGDLVYSVSGVGKLWQWDLDATRWAEQACLVANRTLTRAEWELFLPDLEYDPACWD